MQNNARRPLGRVLISLLLVSVLITSALTLFSCSLSEPATKSEILDNIASTDPEDTKDYAYVMQYFTLWDIPDFDTEKFAWVENHFKRNFNYGDGLPGTSEHATLSATLFVEEHYDQTNLESKYDVTVALINCYIEVIGDTYAIYREPEAFSDYSETISGTFGGIGVVVEYDHIEKTIMVSSVNTDGPADAAGFAPGDFIYAVDGKTVEELGYLNVINHIRGEVGTSVSITVKRDGELITLTATRAVINEKSVAYTVDGDIGYVAVSGFKENTYEQFVEAVDAVIADGAKGIIFDMRNNPGGLVSSVCDMISYLIPTGKSIVSYEFNNSTVVITSEDDVDPKTGESSDHTLDIPMVVICNEYTASSAEIFTSAIRDYRNDGLLSAKIVGKNTYKKGIMQSTFKYKDGSSLTYTIAYYNPPSGVNYHGIGIKPDITIDLTKTEDLQYKTAKRELETLINAN